MASKKVEKTDYSNFEKSIKRLEEITESMEEGKLSMGESLKLFEEGVKLSRQCQKLLLEAEQRVQKLTEENGKSYTEEWESEENEDE